MQYTAMQNGIVLDRADKTKLRLQVYGDKVVRLSCCLDKFSEMCIRDRYSSSNRLIFII